MGRRAAYASIAETIDDCQVILGYINKHNLTDVRVITLSLEAYRYLLREPQVENLHIWKLLDMEALLHQAYLDALAAAAEWVKQFSGDDDNLYDEAVQAELHVHVFYYSLACVRVVEALKPFFLRERWTYLIPPPRRVWLSRYFPHFQKHNTHNFVFKAVSVDIFARAGIRVQHVTPMNRLKLVGLPFDLLRGAFRRIGKDVVEVIRGIRRRVPTIDDRLPDITGPVDVLISGWGIDLWRMISFVELKRHAEQYPQLTILNTVWRPAKVVGFEPDQQDSSNYYSMVIDEEVDRGMAHGPRLSVFSLGEQVSSLVGYITLVVRRSWRLWLWSRTSVSPAELHFGHIRLNALWTIFFAYRHAFLHDRLLRHLFSKLSPTRYVGSDSDLAGMRVEQLSAKRLGAATFSIPHGYQTWTYPAYHYLADTVLTHGRATKRLLLTSIPKHRIRIIGNSHFERKQVPELSDPIRIVIATRSWGGLWSNFGSCQDEYDTQVMGFLRLLTADNRFDVVIKSHPNGDYHAYYDLVASEFPAHVQHISRGWKLKVLVNSCDVLVCMGEVPSFFLEAMFSNIPVVFIEKTITMTQRYLQYDYAGSCEVVGDFEQAYTAINRIVSDRSYRLGLLKKQCAFVSGYTADNPEKRLISYLVDSILQRS